MAIHKVKINLPWQEIGNEDVFFNVYKDNTKLGTITISKGSIEWYPKNAKKTHKMSWTQFDKIIKTHFRK